MDINMSVIPTITMIPKYINGNIIQETRWWLSIPEQRIPPHNRPMDSDEMQHRQCRISYSSHNYKSWTMQFNPSRKDKNRRNLYTAKTKPIPDFSLWSYDASVIGNMCINLHCVSEPQLRSSGGNIDPTHRFRCLFLDLLLIIWRVCASAMVVTKLSSPMF